MTDHSEGDESTRTPTLKNHSHEPANWQVAPGARFTLLECNDVSHQQCVNVVGRCKLFVSAFSVAVAGRVIGG